MCPSGTCWINMVGAGLGVNSFRSWYSAGTDQSVDCTNGNCSDAKLTVTLPSGDQSATGAVTLNVGQLVTVTARTFVNWNTSQAPGNIQICLSTCSVYSNNQTVDLWVNDTYVLRGTDLATGYSVGQWTSNAGTLGVSDSNETLLIESSGTVSMIVRYNVVETNSEGGYWYSPPADTGKVTSISGNFTLPSPTGTYPGLYLGTWVGIGGYSGPPLWQAGVSYVGSNSTYVAWWVAATHDSAFPHDNWSFAIHKNNRISIQLTAGATECTFYIFDITTGKHWSGTVAYVTTTNTAEWAEEATGNISTIPSASLTFSSLTVDEAPGSILGGYVVLYYQAVGMERQINPDSISTSDGFPTFTIGLG
jgi:hypothetical protein